jgi:lipopolysaccharide/colanic/teichoic acid biosynthesis glycosyltransferase
MRAYFITKRIFDVLFSLVILIFFIPLWVGIAILIKIDSKGPIFFIQKRPGYQKKIIRVFKFRSMKINSEIMIKGEEVLKDDTRITRIGKFLRNNKIDEIPQILNIIKGDMSLIGPRPERIESLEDYTEEIEKRLGILPGITGLAQVSGNIYLSLNERYKYDLYYVKNCSFMLDIKILFRTVKVILFGEEKYVNLPLISLGD